MRCASPKFNPQAKLNGAPDVLTVKSRLKSQLAAGDKVKKYRMMEFWRGTRFDNFVLAGNGSLFPFFSRKRVRGLPEQVELT